MGVYLEPAGQKIPFGRLAKAVLGGTERIYIEFIEEDLNGPEGDLGEVQKSLYYQRARRTAKEALQHA